MIIFALNLKRIKQALRWRNKSKFGNIFNEISKVEEEVSIIENKFYISFVDADLDKLCSTKASLLNLQLIEEEFWRQNVASKHIMEGDRNTKYFHAMANGKKSKAFIRKFKLESGDWLNDQSLIYDYVISFFKKSFGYNM